MKSLFTLVRSACALRVRCVVILDSAVPPSKAEWVVFHEVCEGKNNFWMLWDICKIMSGECLHVCGHRRFFASFCVEKRVRFLCFCLYVPLTDNEGPSTRSNEFYYIHSSLLYSPDFYRCSLKDCIRDFMIFRAVRVTLSSHLWGWATVART